MGRVDDEEPDGGGVMARNVLCFRDDWQRATRMKVRCRQMGLRTCRGALSRVDNVGRR